MTVTAGRNETPKLARQISELQAENKHLKQENQLIMEVLVLAGYEWRNQLTLLTLAGEKLKRESSNRLTTHQALAVERIWDGITAMRRVANNYFNFAQVGSADFEIEPAFIDVKRDILLPICAVYEDLLARHDQTCGIETGKDALLVWADHRLLMSACENLLSSAIRYGKQGSRIVMSVVERGTEDEFAIRCNETGVSTEYIDGLLGSFVSDAKRMADGTSDVGLYLAWKIIEAHRGRLWADVQPGQWISFNFTLPKHRATQ